MRPGSWLIISAKHLGRELRSSATAWQAKGLNPESISWDRVQSSVCLFSCLLRCGHLVKHWHVQNHMDMATFQRFGQMHVLSESILYLASPCPNHSQYRTYMVDGSSLETTSDWLMVSKIDPVQAAVEKGKCKRNLTHGFFQEAIWLPKMFAKVVFSRVRTAFSLLGNWRRPSKSLQESYRGQKPACGEQALLDYSNNFKNCHNFHAVLTNATQTPAESLQEQCTPAFVSHGSEGRPRSANDVHAAGVPP